MKYLSEPYGVSVFNGKISVGEPAPDEPLGVSSRNRVQSSHIKSPYSANRTGQTNSITYAQNMKYTKDVNVQRKYPIEPYGVSVLLRENSDGDPAPDEPLGVSPISRVQDSQDKASSSSHITKT